jgi:hypothetical protein
VNADGNPRRRREAQKEGSDEGGFTRSCQACEGTRHNTSAMLMRILTSVVH